MVKQWVQVQPPSNKNRLPPECFIGILGESVQIQFLAIFYIDLNKGFNQI